VVIGDRPAGDRLELVEAQVGRRRSSRALGSPDRHPPPLLDQGMEPRGAKVGWIVLGTELEFVIMVIAVSCVKLLSAHNSTQHTSRKHKV
jgi:hypothetical protein